MALTVVQNSLKLQANGTSGAQSFGAALSNFTPGNTVIVIFAHFPNTLITGVTINGAAATLDVRRIDPVLGFNEIEIWSGVVPASTAHNVVVTPPAGGGDYFTLGILEVSSAGTISVLSTKTTNDGNDVNPTITTTTAQTGDLAVAGFCLNDSYTTTINTPGGWTSIFIEADSNNAEGGAADYQLVSSNGTVTSTWTAGVAVKWSSCSAVYRETGGAVSGATIPTYSRYGTA